MHVALWLSFLMLSTLLFAQHAGADPTYFFEPYQLFRLADRQPERC